MTALTLTYAANATLRRDPTRSVHLRRRYAQDLRGKLQRVNTLIRRTIVDNDALFLTDRRLPLVTSQAQPATRFDFPRRPDKIPAFVAWLEDALDSEVLEPYDPARAGTAVPNRFVRAAYQKGAERAGTELARAGFDVPDRAVAAFLRGPLAVSKLERLYTRNFELLQNMTDDLAQAIRTELTTGLAEGLGPREIARQLSGRMDAIGIHRATVLSRTEIIHSHAESSLDRYQSAGIRGVSAEVELSTASDSRVCEICAGLEGNVYSLREARGIIPVHPQCLLPDADITSGIGITGASKRRYDGEIVVIYTAAGEKLSCTPNHPILARRGWVPAHLLNVGDNVVCHRGRNRISFSNDNAQNMPTRIEDVAKAALASSEVATRKVPVAPEHFHGDGAGSDVAVVGTDSFLGNEVYPPLAQKFAEQPLSFANVKALTFDGLGSLDLGFKADGSPPGGFIGGGRDGLFLGFGHVLHPDFLGLFTTSNLDAIIGKPFSDNVPTDPVLFRKCKNGHTIPVLINNLSDREIVPAVDRRITAGAHLDASMFEPSSDSFVVDPQLVGDVLGTPPGTIFFDDIIDIQIKNVSTHVYNLETTSGMFAANSIITHNCRCAWVPVPLTANQAMWLAMVGMATNRRLARIR